MNIKHILATAAVVFPLAAMAQNIDFESKNWKNLNVYDTWEASPFRIGQLKGNVAVVDNPTLHTLDPITGKVSNTSAKVLGIQRSRYGSNTFGARLDLTQTFELTPQVQYVHLWVYKPTKGRVMVVGLGKRQDRAGQSAETEQFWGLSSVAVEAHQWSEVVIGIKGNGGIDIHSLVVVPDAESPHALKEDFVAYVDNITINNDPKASLLTGYYPINFDPTQRYTRHDRHLDAVSLVSPSDGTTTFATPSQGQKDDAVKQCPIYVKAADKTLLARAGETVRPSVKYTGNWMHSYLYLDANNDGQFSLNEDSNELVSYSFLSNKDNKDAGKNSAGQPLTGSAINTVALPAFTLPTNLSPGYYRLRYKIDWDSADPAGNLSADNNLLSNGGGFVDIRLNIHGDHATLTSNSRNGEVLAADGTRLINKTVPFGKDFAIKMKPENGFEYSGIVIKHGYHLDKDSLYKDNQQWETVFISREYFDESNHSYTLPGRLLDGDVQIEGVFVEEGRYTPPARYKTTKIENGAFAAGTTWYTLQIGQQGYVIAANGTQPIPLRSTELDIEDKAQLWCFVGSEGKGYQIYNMQAGPSLVLASSTNMSSNTGGNTHPTLRPADQLPTGYAARWRFLDSSKLGTGVEYAYMYLDNNPSHKVNNRDDKLAFWTGGQDAGSTLRIREAKVTQGPISKISLPYAPHASHHSGATLYDLSGRRISQPQHGLYVSDGHKVLVR